MDKVHKGGPWTRGPWSVYVLFTYSYANTPLSYFLNYFCHLIWQVITLSINNLHLLPSSFQTFQFASPIFCYQFFASQMEKKKERKRLPCFNSYSLRQKQLRHVHPMLFFHFWSVSSSSQCCLSQLTHQILHTNVGRARRPQSFPTILTETVFKQEFQVSMGPQQLLEWREIANHVYTNYLRFSPAKIKDFKKKRKLKLQIIFSFHLTAFQGFKKALQ